jgi:formamidopyrimidine-DNA glycosylase
MPELPDVESFRRYFDSTSLNKKINNVEVNSKTVLAGISPRALQSRLKGEKFKSTFGHGKYLFAETSKGDFLVMHFGMTGFLSYFKNPEDASKHIRVQINFTNGYHLGYDCARKLGRIDLVDDYNEFIKRKKLGVDPIRENINYQTFKEIVDGRKGTAKSVLMNQEIFAGVGNIYSDEILFQAKINPNSSFEKLKEKDLKEIFNKMKDILKKAISKDADPGKLPDSFLLHYRRPGKDCPVCSGKIKKSTIGGRSSYYCSKHQRLIK